MCWNFEQVVCALEQAFLILILVVFCLLLGLACFSFIGFGSIWRYVILIAYYGLFSLHCKWLSNYSSHYLLEATILTHAWCKSVGTFRYMSALVSTLFLSFSHLSALVLFWEQFGYAPFALVLLWSVIISALCHVLIHYFF